MTKGKAIGTFNRAEMRNVKPLTLILPLCLGALAYTCTAGCSRSATSGLTANPGSAAAAQLSRFGSHIKHVVVIFQENRTFDNLFNGFPGADTAQSGTDSNGNTVPLHAVNLAVPYDLDHSHQAFLTEYNSGSMNGFDKEPVSVQPSASPAPADPAYAYVPESQVQPYWAMAQQYAIADRMFQTNEGPSFPAHQYIVSGTAAIDSTNTVYAMNNPNGLDWGPEGGCDSVSTATVALINPLTNAQPSPVFPCFDHPVLMDLLDSAGISWRYYQAHGGSGFWNGPDAIKHIRYGPDYAKVVWPNTKILNDITNGTLPDVSWVMPTTLESDHPNITDGSGPAWVSQIVNAIGQSQYWRDTAIIITWDDWGGWFDHVAPPQYNYYELGLRVPLIVVSPYAKTGYVSHTQHEFGSILKFIEETYGLKSLGYTDARADDMSDMFDSNRAPLKFMPIKAKALSRADETAQGNPDNDL